MPTKTYKGFVTKAEPKVGYMGHPSVLRKISIGLQDAGLDGRDAAGSLRHLFYGGGDVAEAAGAMDAARQALGTVLKMATTKAVDERVRRGIVRLAVQGDKLAKAIDKLPGQGKGNQAIMATAQQVNAWGLPLQKFGLVIGKMPVLATGFRRGGSDA